MTQKLSKFNAGKLSYNEVLGKLNEIEEIYTQIMGPRSGWSDRLKDCFSELRMTAICQQAPAVEDLERQYESRNSLDF